MATVDDLAERGELVEVDPSDLLGPRKQPFRRIFMLPRAERWMEDTLPGLESDGVIDGVNSPIEQVFDHFEAFVAGEDVSKGAWYPKRLRPVDRLVWELRTPDIRVFGWFWRKGVFIVSGADTKQRCVEHSLYGGYREQCVSDYERLDLDPPKAQDGDEEDVL